MPPELDPNAQPAAPAPIVTNDPPAELTQDPPTDPPATETPPSDPKPATQEDAVAAVRAALDKDKAADPAEAPADPKPAAPVAAVPGDPPADPNAAPDPAAVDYAALADEAGMKGRTRERFVELGENFKKTSAELATERAEREHWQTTAGQWQHVVESTGATPEEFSALLGYTTLVHSNDPADLAQALELLDAERAALAQKLGMDVPGVDPFTGHPDIQQWLEDDEISRTAALALVKQRAQQTAAPADAGAPDPQAELEEALTAGQTQVDDLVARLKAADPLHDQKMALLQPAITLIAQRVHPSQWAAEVSKAYAGIQLAAPRPPTPRPPTPRPLLSGGQGDPAPVKVASTAIEAVNQALGRGGS